MPFAQRQPLPPLEAGQSLFAGREKEIGLYRLQFHRPKDNPQVNLITAISGPGGVGKTRLLDELEWYRPADTAYCRLDSSANLGHDATRLLQAVADGLHRGGEPLPTPHFGRLARRRHTLLEQSLARTADTKPLLRHFYRPALLGLADAAAFTPDLDQFAALHWERDDLALAFENPLGLLTQALVQDLNQLEVAKIVLIFDDFDRLSPVAGEWLLTYLLGYCRDDIECDLRLVLAARDPLADIDGRWESQWGPFIQPLPLASFTPAETADFMQKNSRLTDPAAIDSVAQAAESLPLWLNVWLLGSAEPSPSGRGLDLAGFTPTQRGWLEKAALAGSFDQPRLAALVGSDDGRAAFQWLIGQPSLVRPRGSLGQFALDRTLAEALTGAAATLDRQPLLDYLDQQLDTLRADGQRAAVGTGRPAAIRRKDDSGKIKMSVTAPANPTGQAAPAKIQANRQALALERLRHRPDAPEFAPAIFLEALDDYPPLMFGVLTEAAGLPHLPAIAAAWLTGQWAELAPALTPLTESTPLPAPAQAIACDWLGYAAHSGGDSAAAIDVYRKGLALSQPHAPLYLDRGLAYLARQEYPAAIADFEEAILLRPRSAAILPPAGAGLSATAHARLSARRGRFQPDPPAGPGQRCRLH
jgi:tetratricopeptide (TPR) repeat protein